MTTGIKKLLRVVNVSLTCRSLLSRRVEVKVGRDISDRLSGEDLGRIPRSLIIVEGRGDRLGLRRPGEKLLESGLTFIFGLARRPHFSPVTPSPLIKGRVSRGNLRRFVTVPRRKRISQTDGRTREEQHRSDLPSSQDGFVSTPGLLIVTGLPKITWLTRLNFSAIISGVTSGSPISGVDRVSLTVSLSPNLLSGSDISPRLDVLRTVLNAVTMRGTTPRRTGQPTFTGPGTPRLVLREVSSEDSVLRPGLRP